MRKEYKQLVNAYLSYAFGFWTIFYFILLFSAIFIGEKEEKVKTLFSGEFGLIIAIFLIAFIALFTGIPFYIWIAIREAMLKKKLNTQELYKSSFLAGVVIPPLFCIMIWTLMWLGLRNENSIILFTIVFILGFAECCIRLNKIKSYQNEPPDQKPAPRISGRCS